MMYTGAVFTKQKFREELFLFCWSLSLVSVGFMSEFSRIKFTRGTRNHVNEITEFHGGDQTSVEICR